MMFLDMSVEAIDNFIDFHRSDKNKMSYLDKTIYEDENVSIRNSHKDTR